MADIPLLITSGATWSTFGTHATTTNAIIQRINAFGTNDAVVVTGGSIDGTSIGISAPSTGKFTEATVTTTLNLTGANVIFSNDSISGDKISGGTITINYAELNEQPTADNHATTKLYVDEKLANLKNEMIAYSLIFGG